MRVLPLLLASLLALPLHATATRPRPIDERLISIGRSITLRSAILGEDRELRIYLPPGYGEGDSRYPVLYVLDGESMFGFTTGIVDFFSKSRRIPEMLIVGIVNVDRTRDLTPQPGDADLRRYPASGHADAFLEFLEKEVVPFVDLQYRTEPYRVLAGHSLGGLFAVHAFLSDTGFDAFIASSPSLYWNDRSQLRLARTKLARNASRPRPLFLSVGGDESEERIGDVEALAGIVSSRLGPSASRMIRMDDRDHEDVPFPTIVQGLEFVYTDYWNPARIGEIGFEAFHDRIIDEFHYDIPLPVRFLFSATPYAQRRGCEDMADLMKYWQERHPAIFRRFMDDWVNEGTSRLAVGDTRCAAAMFHLLVTADSQRFEAWKGLGDALHATDDRIGALAAYRRALTLQPDDMDLRLTVRRLTEESSPLR